MRHGMTLPKDNTIMDEYIFQGLPISIENKKGSLRHWFDPHNQEYGITLMQYDYGFVKNTIGTDGDAVDVYVGPNPASKLVVVITQAKAPDFKEVDEQKCMLGFNSADQAKEAYLAHYNDPRFFMSMKTMSIEEFETKLKTNEGKLLKSKIKYMHNIEKSLSSVIASFIRKKELEYRPKSAEEQPAIGSNKALLFTEPPPVHVRRVPFYPPIMSTKVEK